MSGGQLTPYDEFPVHQYARPFSELPVSDFNWDDGYYFGVYNAAAGVFLYTGLRVTPNANVVGAYAGLSVGGKQTTFRASRVWRPDYALGIGPLRYEVLTPLQEIRLVLEPNDSPLSFDLRWTGLTPPHVEDHHFARTGGRITTDQTRYGQNGTAEGWIELDGTRYEVTPHEWYGDRDHSWGLYEPRAPLSNPKEWLPPVERPANARKLRFWLPFQSRDLTGFYHFHEDRHGNVPSGDVFGSPFHGVVNRVGGPEPESLNLVEGRHDLVFEPGTKLLRSGSVDLLDEKGRPWRQSFTVASPPWTTFPIGYYMGTWRDGGNIHTYHGSSEPYQEWDVIDFSSQPANHTTYDGRSYEGIYGAEYLLEVHTEGPGVDSHGLGHLEFFMHRDYERYSPTRSDASPRSARPQPPA